MRELALVPKVQNQLITLLQHLTIDVERMISIRARKRRIAHPTGTAPIYHFHFMAKTLIEDEEGRPFIDAGSALHHAKLVAAQFSESGILFGCTIVVAFNDEVLFEVPLSGSLN
jgi:hypothetical protein